MSITTLEIGPAGAPLFHFETDDSSLVSAEYTSGVDIIGIRLSIDTTKIVVDYPYGPDSAEAIAGLDFSCVVTSDGYVMCTNKVFSDIKNLPYGTEARLYRRGVLFLKFYKQQLSKTSGTKYLITFISAIGLLEGQKHYGGFYANTSFGAMLSDILGESVPYTVSDEVARLPVRRGYLPYRSKRDNLHALSFAYGVMVGRNADGDMDFHFITNSDPTIVSPEEFYDGGDIQDPDGVTAVDVTEHSFMALSTDEAVVVYDNTDGSETASQTFIDFKDNAPLHDLTVTGSLVIHSSNANYAIVSGTGVLKGQKYIHSTRILTKFADTEKPSRDKVATLADNTMVTVLSSENVADRLLAYCSKKQIVKSSMIIKSQKPGDLISGIDPFGRALSGFLSSVNGIISTKIKGTCEFVSNYVPTGQGTNYSKYVVLTGSGTWTIPDEVKNRSDPTIRVTLIGGGHGGYKGSPGTKGTESSANSHTYPTSGKGGAGGRPGEGGKVYTVTIDCSNLTELAYRCGAGGGSDEAGTATTMGGYSSDSGAIVVSGVVNIFTGDIFAKAGTMWGISGGDGAAYQYAGTTVTQGYHTWYPGGKGTRATVEGREVDAYSDGGYGGGPAYGRNGWDGEDGIATSLTQIGGSTGGDGATPIKALRANGIGEGGDGGHGGGGAGAGGYGQWGTNSPTANPGWSFGQNGEPGDGGLGADGGDGGIIIYY